MKARFRVVYFTNLLDMVQMKPVETYEEALAQATTLMCEQPHLIVQIAKYYSDANLWLCSAVPTCGVCGTTLTQPNFHYCERHLRPLYRAIRSTFCPN